MALVNLTAGELAYIAQALDAYYSNGLRPDLHNGVVEKVAAAITAKYEEALENITSDITSDITSNLKEENEMVFGVVDLTDIDGSLR